MGFSYIQVMKAYNIFGEDVHSRIFYMVEIGGISAAIAEMERLLSDACILI